MTNTKQLTEAQQANLDIIIGVGGGIYRRSGAWYPLAAGPCEMVRGLNSVALRGLVKAGKLEHARTDDGDSQTYKIKGAADAQAMVGASCFHKGEHGTIIAAELCYAEPMLRVQFGERIALLRATEIGKA